MNVWWEFVSAGVEEVLCGLSDCDRFVFVLWLLPDDYTMKCFPLDNPKAMVSGRGALES